MIVHAGRRGKAAHKRLLDSGVDSGSGQVGIPKDTLKEERNSWMRACAGTFPLNGAEMAGVQESHRRQLIRRERENSILPGRRCGCSMPTVSHKGFALTVRSLSGSLSSRICWRHCCSDSLLPYLWQRQNDWIPATLESKKGIFRPGKAYSGKLMVGQTA